jgi:hypothetical protein
MQKNAVSVEVNLHIKRSKTKTEKKVTIKEEPSTSSEGKLDSLIKTMERMMDKMSIKEKSTEPLIINPNYRGQQQQNQYRVRQRERGQDPTEQKFVHHSSRITHKVPRKMKRFQRQIIFLKMTNNLSFLTKEDEYLAMPFVPDQQYVPSNNDILAVETEDYQRGYMNALSQVQKQYNLRNRNVPVNANQKGTKSLADIHNKDMTSNSQSKEKDPVAANQGKNNEASTSIPRKDKEVQTGGLRKEVQIGGQRKELLIREQHENKDSPSKEVEKNPTLFSLENEIANLKFPFP